jgi:hypothetical protein
MVDTRICSDCGGFRQILRNWDECVMLEVLSGRFPGFSPSDRLFSKSSLDVAYFGSGSRAIKPRRTRW